MGETEITREGLARLNDELERLTTDGRRDIAERLRHAVASEANAGESADFLDVREEQARLEQRIALLEQRLRTVRVVEAEPGNDRVDLGEMVRLHDLDSGEQFELELVGPLEANPTAGRVSTQSPVGRAILGRRYGDIAEVDAPRGRLRFEILAVETPRSDRAA